MEITTLEKKPNVFEKCLKLIEKSFGYKNSHSFAVDFYPLVNDENHRNCFIITEGDNVIAHIGVLKRIIKIGNHDFKVNFYGGIAVDENTRGKGVFKKLFNHVLENNLACHLHLLWSDKINMYEKFHFFPAISQYEYSHIGVSNGDYIKCRYDELSGQEQITIQKLYEKDSKIKILRSFKDWQKIKEIKSADFYIKRQQQEIVDYFVMNKGADLKGIIHEHRELDEAKLNKLRGHGKVWTSKAYGSEVNNLLYSSLVRPGESFIEFIAHYTKGQIKVLSFDFDGVDFCFKSKDYYLPMEDFITGVLGPGQFKELENIEPIFICGLDSI
jgi:predicted N-acetyltransferase YhbS